MRDTAHAAMCVYCGEAVIYDTREVSDMAQAHAQIVQHDQSCPKNPLVAEIASLRQRLAESEEDARRYRYIRDHQYWMRSQGTGGDEPYSVVGVKFNYADDFQARAMLDYHIDRRIKAEANNSRLENQMSDHGNDGANPALTRFCADVKKDLEEQAKLGVSVPAGAFKQADDPAAMKEYMSMRVADCSDLLISLESMGGGK